MCELCRMGLDYRGGGGGASGVGSGSAGAPVVEPLTTAQLAARIDAVQEPLPAPVDRWHATNAAPLRLTYKFETSQPMDAPWASYSGWTAFTDTQKGVVRAALAEFADVINVEFVETTAADPDINFGRVLLPGRLGGYGHYQFGYGLSNGVAVNKVWDGAAVFNIQRTLTGPDDMNLVLHELGHVLGLKHVHDDGFTSGPYLPAAEDDSRYTVMSYNEVPGTDDFTDRLMLYDIAALQDRWSVNTRTRAGDDTYAARTDGGIDTIWDAGGTDTISAAGLTVGVEIDLRAGAFSSLGAADNLAIAYGAVIERAVGGAGDDVFRGNSADNMFTGGAGIDLVDYGHLTGAVMVDLSGNLWRVTVAGGGIGQDLFSGIEGFITGAGADTLIGSAGNDRLFAGAGADLLFGARAGATPPTNTGADTLDGGAGDDTMWGFDGADTLLGAAGNDALVGGAGDDRLEGGDGDDLLFGADFTAAGAFATGSGADTLIGGAGNDNAWGGDGDDVIQLGAATGFEYAEGGDGADTITGGAHAAYLLGGAGNDVVTGGAGFDYIWGGAGADIFSFRRGDSYDGVYDFDRAQGDRLRLDPAFGVTTFAAFQAAIVSGAGFTQLTVNGGLDQITLFGVGAGQWTSAMVEFA